MTLKVIINNFNCFQTFVGAELPNGEHLPEDCTFISKSETEVGGIKEVIKLKLTKQNIKVIKEVINLKLLSKQIKGIK
jgi:hypothetical protein